MARGIWGIDVSKYSVKAARIEKNKDALELTAVDVIQYAGAHAGDNNALDEQIREALTDLKAKNKIGKERVALSMPGHSTFNRLIKLPPVDDAKLDEIVRYEAQSQIPFNIDEVIWDYQVIEREYAPGEEKEVILFAIKRDIVEQFLENIKPVGLNVDSIQFGPVGLYNHLMYDQDVGQSAVALDMGSDNTDLIILDGSKFWIRNLPITGNDITRALKKVFNIPFAEAEKLKLKAGRSQQAQKIFQAIQPVLRDLVGEIHRSIGYYKSISKSIRFDRILLLGNATKTINFQKFLSQSLQMPAARMQKLNRIASSKVDPGLLNNALPSLATALGLAIQGCGNSSNRINLLPPSYLRRQELNRKKPSLIASAALLFATLGMMYMDASGEAQELRDLHRNIGNRVTELQAVQTNYDSAKSLLGPLVEKLKPYTRLPSRRDLLPDVFNMVNANVPDNEARDPRTQVSNDKDKIWVLEWEFKELSLDPVAASKMGGGKKASAPTLPDKRGLDVRLEVAIKRRNNKNEAAAFVGQKLFNWNTKINKVHKQGPSLIDKYKLALGYEKGTASWGTEVGDPMDLPLPERVKVETVSSGGGLFDSLEADPAMEVPKEQFQRITIRLHIPMEPEEEPAPEGDTPETKKEGN